MPLTPEQIAKIRQKEAALPDALKRDPNVNYYEGWFFVTLNTRDNVPVLSSCVGDVHVANGEPGAPHCEYSDVGRGVLEAWLKMPQIHPMVEIDICEVMPEHFHGLLHLLPGNKRHLGHLIGGFMSGCSHAYWDTLGIDWQSNRYDKGASALQIDRDNDHTTSYRGPALFVRGYNDMEPVPDEEVEVKRAYIRDQARKRLIQGDRHECFRKYRNCHSKGWTWERVMGAVSKDRSLGYNAERCAAAQNNIATRLNKDTAGLCLDYIGSKSLLFAERRLPLVCHRADETRFLQQKDAMMKAAREGCIIVSAFISPKERDIRQLLMLERLPFIEILDNGIAEKYKGVGKAFYALAEERLCQITPWTYVYQKDTIVKREMCLVMNELARVICGVADDWWRNA